MAGPLDGVRILDWTQWQMGPVATAMMADMGAEVIHVENRVTGDPGRGLRRTAGVSSLLQGRSAYFEINNRGKKSLTLDVTKEKGKAVIYRLVEKSDCFVHNFRQGVPEKVRLSYEVLRQYNPKLVYVAASGYGPKGPDAMEPAFDYVGLARSGIMTMVGEPDMPPLVMQMGIADQIGAIMTAYGILTGLVARERLGVGQRVDVSHLGSLIALQGLGIGMELYTGQAVPRQSRKKSANSLWNYYPCEDGKWFMLAGLHSERYWPLVCKALGIEHLEKNPKFENMEKRTENCEELTTIIEKVFATKPGQEWITVFRETGDVPCTLVQTITEVINDPQSLANEYIIRSHHEILGPVKVVGNPVQLSETPGEVRCEAPEFGQHTEEVLIEVGGYTWEEISRLRDEEVI